MGGKSRLVSVTGLLLACCVAACGDDAPKGFAIKQGGDHPDSRGTGDAGRHGGGARGGHPGMGGMGGGMSMPSPSPLPPPASSFALGSVCEEDGWCWYNPLPSGAWWRAVAGAGRTDLWIGGASRNLLRFDGGRWTTTPSSLLITEGIWAASENDVWFAGISRPGVAGIAHWDGTAMTLTAELGCCEMHDVWGSSANDVYATGPGILQHWNGSAWSTVPGIGGSSVSGSGPNDVWVGASDGMWHFDGTSWSRSAELEGALVVGVSAVGPDDVWAAVLRPGTGFAMHFDGTSWTVSFETGDNINTNLQGIHASSPTSVWLFGRAWVESESRGYLNHFDGNTWTRAPAAPTSIYEVRGAPGLGDIGVGQNGGIVRLTAAPAPGFTDLRTGPAQSLFGTWGSSPMDMWAVGMRGTVLHADGQTVASVPAGTATRLDDVWGTGPADVWTVGQGGVVLHFDGNTFAPVESGTTADLNAVFAAAPNDVWIAGVNATLLHWDGSSMTPVALPGAPADAVIRDVHGIAADDIWLAGGGTASAPAFVAHYDGTAWSPIELITSDFGAGDPLTRVWALAADDVWVAVFRTFAVGGGLASVYEHFDGTAWTSVLAQPGAEPFMFPNRSGASFVFGEHDRWLVDVLGTWQRNTR
jgi:hypothetical protein